MALASRAFFLWVASFLSWVSGALFSLESFLLLLPSVSSTSRCQWFQGCFIRIFCLYAYSIYKHFIKRFLGTIHITFLHPATSLYISITSNTAPLRSKLYRLCTHCSGECIEVVSTITLMVVRPRWLWLRAGGDVIINKNEIQWGRSYISTVAAY
jgi:hypothetical protein